MYSRRQGRLLLQKNNFALNREGNMDRFCIISACTRGKLNLILSLWSHISLQNFAPFFIEKSGLKIFEFLFRILTTIKSTAFACFCMKLTQFCNLNKKIRNFCFGHFKGTVV